VDSSTTVSTMVPQFRAGLNAFLDALPGDPEIALISTGGQIRIRVPPTTDRDRLHKAANAFTSDGGGNSFLDTLLEADKRFLQVGGRYRPVFVILMTDGLSQGNPANFIRWYTDQHFNVPIYAIMFGEADASQGGKSNALRTASIFAPSNQPQARGSENESHNPDGSRRAFRENRENSWNCRAQYCGHWRSYSHPSRRKGAVENS